MTHSKCIGPVSRVLTVTIVAIAMFAVLPAAPRDIPKDGIDREFFRLRGLLQNANVKLQNDVADLGAAQSGATSVAQTCCSGNL
ncbi:MAG: hypothetical protein OEV00_04050, partial [Acidobacteriota bacterium]|nr:hypothetical protein [Acidobacteriota bacterium]